MRIISKSFPLYNIIYFNCSTVKRLSFGLIFLFFLGPLSAQTTKELVDQDTTTIQALDTLSQEIITVFLDCEVCDNNFIRQQINFVNYVRDPTLGQLHLFITSQGTAGGGRVFTLSFIGKQRFWTSTIPLATLLSKPTPEMRSGRV